MEHKIVISDCDHNSVDIEMSTFRESGLTCDKLQCMTEEELITGCADATVMIVQNARITRNVLQNLPKLKHIVRYGVGFDAVDIGTARELGIQVSNVPDYGTHEVADQAAALTLALYRKLNLADSAVRQGRWNYEEFIPIHRFSALTVGLIGIGRIGEQYALRMNAFGPKIIAVDDKARSIPDFVTIKSFEEVIKQSDIISIHCPADGNIDLIGADEINSMKDGVIIVNVSRGGIINEEALDKALASGKVSGCGLDVTAVEPIPADNPLLRHKNLTITPHMGWYTEEAAKELKQKVAQEAIRFVKGEKILYSVID